MICQIETEQENLCFFFLFGLLVLADEEIHLDPLLSTSPSKQPILAFIKAAKRYPQSCSSFPWRVQLVNHFRAP
jgi:hypothetical protein